LTYTAGGEVVVFSQKWNVLIPKLCWNWEIEEIHHFVKENDISTLVFDDELSPSQQKKSSKNNSKILDRTHLILDILRNVPKLLMQEHR
jgi:GTP-binding protein HflX